VTLWGFAVQRWQFTLVLFGLLIALGVSSLNAIPRSEDPNLDFPHSTVLVFYPGADAQEIERVVIDPVEDAVAELENVKKIESTARDGVGVVGIEFEYGHDPERQYDQVVRELNALAPRLPEGVVGWEVRRANPGLVNLIQMALVSETANWRELEHRARQLEDLIETVPAVRKAETWAYPKSEVRIAVDLQRLSRSGITLGQLAGAIKSENQSIPGGSVDVGPRRFNLRTSGSYRSLAEIEETIVGATGGRPVYVRDVATVSWDSEEERYVGRFNGQRAVFVTANLKDDQDVFAARDAIYAKVTAWETSLPADMRLERGFDQSANVGRRLSQLGEDFAIAIGFVALTLLPLGLRAGAVVMISIPLSLALGVAALYFAGFSLNQMSISGLVLALGLLVDDSIVVVENIARWGRLGYSRVDAAIGATSQIWRAVVGCTAALLLAFLPLLFLPEGAGEFVRSLPAAVLFTVLGSLLIALTIIPFLARRLLRGQQPPPQHFGDVLPFDWLHAGIGNALEDLVQRLLDLLAELVALRRVRREERGHQSAARNAPRRLGQALEEVLGLAEPGRVHPDDLPRPHQHLVEQDQRRQTIFRRQREQLFHDIRRRRGIPLLVLLPENLQSGLAAQLPGQRAPGHLEPADRSVRRLHIHPGFEVELVEGQRRDARLGRHGTDVRDELVHRRQLRQLVRR